MSLHRWYSSLPTTGSGRILHTVTAASSSTKIPIYMSALRFIACFVTFPF
jgi:hypothetical protein